MTKCSVKMEAYTKGRGRIKHNRIRITRYRIRLFEWQADTTMKQAGFFSASSIHWVSVLDVNFAFGEGRAVVPECLFQDAT